MRCKALKPTSDSRLQDFLVCTQLSEHSIECSLQCLSQAPKHHLDPGQQGIPMARRLPPPIMGLSTGIPMARRLRPQSSSHPKAGSLEPPVPSLEEGLCQ